MKLVKQNGKWVDPQERSLRYGLSGFVRCCLAGEDIESKPWQKNLLMVSGMDKLGTVAIADLFRYCAVGTGVAGTPSVSSRTDANTYTQAANTVTRTAGAVDFTADDVGRMIRFSDTAHSLAVITAYTDATHVDVDRILTGITNKTAVIYYTEKTALDTETRRTGTCSLATSANGQTQGTGSSINVTTWLRTFLFDAETGASETVTGTYSRAGSVVTRATGARDFTAADVGKIIHFVTSGVEAAITAYTDASHVTVATSGTLAAQSIVLYPFNTYSEVGFSDSEVALDPINIRVVLDTPINVNIATPLQPSQQLMVQYTFIVTVAAAGAYASGVYPSFTLGAGIVTDPTNAMSSNKNGKYSVETMLFSDITAEGASDLSNPLLDPYYGGTAAISPVSEAITPFVTHDRSAGTFTTELVPDPYVTGSFTQTHTGTFGLNDAISSVLRSLMIYDANSGNAAFTVLFTNNQNKDATHSLQVVFRKTWSWDF